MILISTLVAVRNWEVLYSGPLTRVCSSKGLGRLSQKKEEVGSFEAGFSGGNSAGIVLEATCQNSQGSY